VDVWVGFQKAAVSPLAIHHLLEVQGRVPMSRNQIPTATSSSSVADILERVLDKGVVIAGDIRVKLVNIELLTIQIRLVICSIEKAKEIGMDWWNTSIQKGDQATVADASHDASHDAALIASRLATVESRLRDFEAALTSGD
jgi:hypothetical protein